MITIRHAVGTALGAVAGRSHRSNSVSWTGFLGAAVYATSLMVLNGPTAAQEAPAASSSSGGTVSLEEVTVTGSRIKRTTDFNTPTPTTVIDSATMDSLGLVNVGQAATFAPSNVSTFTPANTGNSNFFTGSFIADLRGLNPYFGSRTLVLLNGQRLVNSNQGDSFDLNLVPQVLVTRIDTVTGGASAAYGSGAIAGVVNVLLDNKLEGGKITGDFYQTSHSDGRDRHFGAAYGHGLFDNRVHILIGGEYENSDAVGCEFARSWCAQNVGEYQLGNTPPSSGSAGILGYGSNVRSNFNSTTGILYSLANFGGFHGAPPVVSLTPDGSAALPYTTGTPQISFADDVQGGDGIPIYQYANLQAPVNRGTGMFAVTAQVTETINFKADVLLAREETTNYNGGASTLANYLTPQNAYGCPGTPNVNAFFGVVGSTCVNPGSPTIAAALNQQQFFPGADGAFENKDWTAQTQGLTRFTQT